MSSLETQKVNVHAKKRRYSNLLTIGKEPTRSQFLTISVAVFVLLLLIWWLATSSGTIKPIFLPGIENVLLRMITLAQNGTLQSDIASSLYRMIIAFTISSLMAIIIGVLAGCYGLFKAIVEPLVDFIRYMPVVAFVPLTILWTGTDDIQKFLVIWIGTFFQQVLMMIDAIKRVPSDFVGLGRTLGLSDRKTLLQIVIPSALPSIWDALRISLGWAWTWLVLAELVASTSGLGYRIVVSQRYFQTDTIIGYILLLGFLGLITDQIMRAAEHVLFRYNRRRS
ncbi:ABC transporter permease [Klebsiella pneumoniae]|jgi:NitT/TauT family transport system permease protein|uniref:ABC transporter permease n=1 Tax=Klebsiella TaxID=570 RepID=UPI0004A84EBB|nr:MULTISPECIES: ABC transporter permease [Klebsiella]ELK7334616.1 ABC transporter permease [Enterobacter cloacae]MDU4125116.1 ABC transporter permease [Clostridioides difficile]MDU6063986.1 ABC transporter permease [Anaerococcus sp.]QLX18553.1 ABC transporter permease [Klebsiella oxytoca]HCB0261834.1 ABC transporter permease [Klebsiella quasipneumoniae subsp. similipneumoniae]